MVPHWSSAAIRRDSGQSPPIPRSGHSISQGKSFLHCSPTPSSDLCRVLEEERLLPSLAAPNTHSSRAHLGRLLTQKGRSPKAGFLGPRTSSPSGTPTLQASLRQGGIRTGQPPTTDFSPRENPSRLLGSECRTKSQSAWLRGSLAAARGGGLKEASFRAGPLPAQSRWPQGGEGSEPSPHRSGLRLGFSPARSARVDLTHQLAAAASSTLTPSCPVRRGALAVGLERSLALLPVGSEGPPRLHLPPENTGT